MSDDSNDKASALGDATRHAIAKLDEVNRAKEYGGRVDVADTTAELEAALGKAHSALPVGESAAIWARCGAYLSEHDPETYRLMYGIAVALCVLNEAPVTS